MSWKYWMIFAAVFCAGLTACGDDDGAPVTDMGGSPDMYVPPEDLGPPTDGGITDSGTPTGQCDPYVATSCPATEKCAIVIRNSGLPTAAVTFECVPRTDLRLAGEVCNFANLPGGTRVDGGVVDYFDLCEQGTFCWDTPPIPGYPPQPRSCQPICGADGVFCGDSEYCLLLNSDDPATTTVVEPTFGVCTPAVGCDPVLQTGCADPLDACYLVYSTRLEMLGACLKVDHDADAGTPFAVGAPCDYAAQCAPGAGCLPTVVGGVFGDGARACREYCATAGPVAIDAGTPALDAGTPALDAGTPAVDAGPDVDAAVDDAAADDAAVDDAAVEVDAGPSPVDAGPPDLGTDAGPPRNGACPAALSCVAFPIGDPDAGMPVRVPTDPGLCQ